jgi:hypothetical protein
VRYGDLIKNKNKNKKVKILQAPQKDFMHFIAPVLEILLTTSIRHWFVLQLGTP